MEKSTKSIKTKQKSLQSSRTSSAHLSDLAPEDKAKVAKLVDQIIELGRENETLKKKITNLETRESENLSKIELGLSESIFELTAKIQQLENHRSDALKLLHLYQQKISQLVLENQMSKRLIEEANVRITLQMSQINDLERLVFEQHGMIESIQKRNSLSENQEELLMTTQQQLKIVSSENDIWQNKFHQLEENSKYLANQIDELLPQLSLKNTKIQQLEQVINEFEGQKSQQPKQLVDKDSQTDLLPHPPLLEVLFDDNNQRRPSPSPSPLPLPLPSSDPVPVRVPDHHHHHPQLFESSNLVNGENSATTASVASSRHLEIEFLQPNIPSPPRKLLTHRDEFKTNTRGVQTNSSSDQDDFEVLFPSQKKKHLKESKKLHTTKSTNSHREISSSQMRSLHSHDPPVKSFNTLKSNGQKSQSSHVEVRTPFKSTRRNMLEVSQDNKIYNQSLEIYNSSLFDLVERMEELDSSYSSASVLR